MKIIHDEIDDEKEKGLKALKKSIANRNNFLRLSKMSEPKINILIGIFVSILQGSLLPIFGIFLGKMLFILQYNPYLPFVNPLDQIRKDADFYCLMMLLCAIASFFTGFS